MGRTKGSQNKEKVDDVYTLSPELRLQLIANLLIEILIEEQECKTTN
jgi:hypothetical protein